MKTTQAFRDKQKVYDDSHRDQIREYARQYYQKHKKEMREQQKVYRRGYRMFYDDKLSKEVREDGCKCVRCGSTHDLQSHHIVPLTVAGTSNKKSNLIPLCRSCHKKLHSLYNEYEISVANHFVEICDDFIHNN